jgi:branched-chain amino acid aminotransferase
MAFTADRIETERSSTLKPLVPLAGVVFGTVFTDHMFIAEYDDGWKSLKIVPFQNISLPPQASVFHYAVSAFEGMKAFRDSAGRVRLFRPDRNWARFARSCRRLALPEIDLSEVQNALDQLLRVESRWVPYERGYSLYIRPTIIGTTLSIGVKASRQAIFYIILSPVGPYYPTGFKPVQLWACTEYLRAWVGGTGCYKVGANYAITILPGSVAYEKHAQQVLWLYGPERYVTEVGSMNLLGIWINKQGEKELITAGLEDGLILEGVTRDSVLALARQEPDLKVTEARWTIGELIEAIQEKRLLEIFGTGTAAVVSPVDRILFEDKWYDVPTTGGDGAGYYAGKFLNILQDIQYGVIDHPWSIVVEV